MRPPTSSHLLRDLTSMGEISLPRLVLRLTGSVEDTLQSLADLRDQHLVQISGDEDALERLIERAVELQREDLPPDHFRKSIFQYIRSTPELKDATVTLTRRGLSSATRY